MKNNNILVEKSYAFALRVVKLRRYLLSEKDERDMSKQILRSGTSIGANVEEAIGAQSNKDFQHKLSIAYKEARETHYWIRLLRDSEFIGLDQATSLLDDCDELLKISGSIIVTLKKQRDSEEGSDS
jgi:four helix bundle protein